MKTQPIGKLVAVLATLMFIFLSFEFLSCEPTRPGGAWRFDGTKQPLMATGGGPQVPFPPSTFQA